MCWEDQKIARLKYSQDTYSGNTGSVASQQLPPNIYRCGIRISNDLVMNFDPISGQDWWACKIFKGTSAINAHLLNSMNIYNNGFISIEEYGFDICGPLLVTFQDLTSPYNWYIHEIFLNYKNQLDS